MRLDISRAVLSDVGRKLLLFMRTIFIAADDALRPLVTVHIVTATNERLCKYDAVRVVNMERRASPLK